jgi:hypothetical protein
MIPVRADAFHGTAARLSDKPPGTEAIPGPGDFQLRSECDMTGIVYVPAASNANTKCLPRMFSARAPFETRAPAGGPAERGAAEIR